MRRRSVLKLACAAIAAGTLWAGASAAQFDVSAFGERWIQIESQPTLYDAQVAARGYAQRLSDVRIFRADSGWFAIVIGPEAVDTAETARRRWIAQGLIPADSQLRHGRLYRESFGY